MTTEPLPKTGFKSEKEASLFSLISKSNYIQEDVEDLEALNRLKNRLIKIREENNCVRVVMQDKDYPLEIPPQVVAEIKILEHQLKAKKSKIRVQKMRAFQDFLRNSFFDLKKSPHNQNAILTFRSQIQKIKSQISEPYFNGVAFLREKEGMIQVRPYLARQIEKLEALRLGQRQALERFLGGEEHLHDDLQHFNNPLPPLEKAVLVSLSRLLDQMISLCLTGNEEKSLNKITVKTFHHPLSANPQESDSFDIFDAHTKLFSLRSKLRTALEHDKAKLEAEIKRLDAKIKAHRSK